MADYRQYTCDDRARYYVTAFKAVGEDSRVIWFGGRSSGEFANIFWGRWSTGTMAGEWWDVPYGAARGSGTLELQTGGSGLEGDTSLSRTAQTGGFGGQRWSMVDTRRHRYLPLISPEVVRNPDLTGLWRSDQGSIYYIRDTGSTVVWFASIEGRAFANCFKGTSSGMDVGGRWVDIPYGRARGMGHIRLRADAENNATTLDVVSSSVFYGDSHLDKIEG